MTEDNGALDFLEEPVSLDSKALGALQSKLEHLTEIRSRVIEVKESLKELEKLETEMSRKEIPEFLLKFGIRDVTLASGEKVTIKEDLALSVPKTDPVKRSKVMKFLIDNGGGGLIKDELSLQDPTIAVIELLDESAVQYKREQSVNTSSLKAFARGLLGLKKNTVATKDVTDFPAELNLYVYRETVVKK